MKRLLALILVFLLMCIAVPYALAENGSLEGDSVLLAPPEGIVSEVSYVLKDASDNVISDAVLTIEGAPSGVTAEDGKLYLSGSSLEAGSFTVTMSGGGITASKTVTVNETRIYEDFESFSVGDAVDGNALTLKKLDGTTFSTSVYQNTGAVIAEESVGGNKYSDGELSAIFERAGLSRNTKRLTVSAKLKFDDNWQTGVGMTASDGSSTYEFGFLYRKRLAESYWTNYRNFEGATGEVHTWGTVPPSSDWANVKISLDLYKGEYYMTDNGTRLFVDVDSVNHTGVFNVGRDVTDTDKWLYMITSQANIDDLAVYSGVDVTDEIVPEIFADIPEKIAVSENEDVLFPIDASVKYLGGEIVWTSTSSDITAADGKVRVDSGATPGNYTLTATSSVDAGVTRDFPVQISAGFESASSENGILANVSGHILLKAKATGTGSVTVSGNDSLIIPVENSESAKELIIYINSYDKTYSAYLDRKNIGKGETELLNATGVTLSGVALTDVYFGSLKDMLPLAVDVTNDGVIAIDQMVTAKWDIFNPCKYEVTGENILWQISETADGIKSMLATSESIDILPEQGGKYITLSLGITSNGGNGEMTVLPTKQIQSILTASEVIGGISFDIINSFGETTLIPMAVLYKDGKVFDIYAMKIETSDVFVNRTLPITSEYDGAAVYLSNTDMAPVTGVTKIGSVPEIYTPASGNGLAYENGKITVSEGERRAALVYRPKTEGTFKETFTKNDVLSAITESGVSVWDKLAFCDVIDNKVSFNLGLVDSGVYKLSTVSKIGAEKGLYFGVDFDKMYKSNELKEASESEFKAILGNFSDLADSKLSEIYDAYSSLYDKEKVGNFHNGESFDMDKLEAVVYFAAFLEDNAYEEELKEAFDLLELDTEGISLLAKNADFDEAVKSVLWKGTLAETNESILDIAVLQGIYRAANYKDTAKYLDAIDYENYNKAKKKEKIQSGVCGTLFDDIDALKDEIDEIINDSSSSGSSGGGGGSSSGGNKTGMTSVASLAGGANSGNTTGSSFAKFTDVKENHWANSDISFLAEKKILNGMPDGSFAPDKSITRAEYVKILCSAFSFDGEDEAKAFSDVDANEWFYEFVEKASKSGIITGDGDSFKPYESITRQDAAVMLYRALTKLGVTFAESENNLSDAEKIAPYAQEAVNALCTKNIIKGFDDGSFMPEENITRAQTAAIIARVLR